MQFPFHGMLIVGCLAHGAASRCREGRAAEALLQEAKFKKKASLFLTDWKTPTRPYPLRNKVMPVIGDTLTGGRESG